MPRISRFERVYCRFESRFAETWPTGAWRTAPANSADLDEFFGSRLNSIPVVFSPLLTFDTANIEVATDVRPVFMVFALPRDQVEPDAGTVE